MHVSVKFETCPSEQYIIISHENNVQGMRIIRHIYFICHSILHYWGYSLYINEDMWKCLMQEKKTKLSQNFMLNCFSTNSGSYYCRHPHRLKFAIHRHLTRHNANSMSIQNVVCTFPVLCAPLQGSHISIVLWTDPFALNCDLGYALDRKEKDFVLNIPTYSDRISSLYIFL